MSIDVKVSVQDKLTGELKKIQQQLKKLPQEAYNHFVSVTPIDTGNARRRTKLKGDVIQARYPYAQRLDEGWSKQAPDGMSLPTERFLRRRIKQIPGK